MSCRDCQAAHHRECWSAHGGCSACNRAPQPGLAPDASAAGPSRLDIVGGAVTLGAAVALLAALVAVTLTQPLALDSRIFGVGVFTALPCLTSVGACLHQALRGGDS